MNKAIIVGNVGKDPEIRDIASGTKVASFSVATARRWKDKDGNKKEETDWHNVTAFGPTASVVERFVTKGSKVCIEGRIRTRNYDDKDGVKRYVTEIIVENLELLSYRESNTTNDTQSSYEAPAF
jgi:single-strand DNA-binding protein